MFDFMDRVVMPAVVLLGVIFAVVVLCMLVSDPIYCADRWARSGTQAEYQFGAGCMVQRTDGTWVPERAVRNAGK